MACTPPTLKIRSAPASFGIGSLVESWADPEVLKEQIRNNQVLYANDGVDISQVVLDKLNADYRAQPRVKMLYSPD